MQIEYTFFCINVLKIKPGTMKLKNYEFDIKINFSVLIIKSQ